jgi:hypothetical protein
MNKRIDYSNLGGFPLTQDTLKFMQDSYRPALGVMALLAGNKTILSGVIVNGSNVSDGWISYNGELIPFIGGGIAADVVIDEVGTAVTFQDNNQRTVYFTKTARCGAPGTFPLSDLQQLPTLISFFNQYLQHTHSWQSITNKPAGYITYVGSINIGDVGGSAPGGISANDSIITVNIPDQGDANYTVGGSLVGQSSDLNTDNDVLWIVGAQMSSSFKLALREVSPNTQNLVFKYTITKSL